MARSLADILQDGMAAARVAADKNGPIWCVMLDDPTGHLWCRRDNFELPNAVAVLYGCRIPTSVSETDDANVARVNAKTPICTLAVPESFMKLFVGVLRNNDLHGTYRQAGTSKEYKF